MKYVITGSLGNISKPLTAALVKAGNHVTVITSSPQNISAIEAMGAEAAAGSVEDAAFLTSAFTGADAVYTMVPPTLTATDWKGHIAKIAENYTAAINNAGVKYVVNLSSVGAHMQEGAGPVSGLYRAEKALNTLTGVNIKHLRPVYFYANLLASIGMIKHMGIMGANFGEKPFALVHTNDIAEVAIEELSNLNFTGHTVRYIAGDEKTGFEIAKALGSAIGQPDIPWVVFTDEQSLQGMLQAGLPEETAKNYTEMGAAIRNGEMYSHYLSSHITASGKIKIEDFAKQFAAAFHA